MCGLLDKAEIERFKSKGRDKRFFGRWQLVKKNMQEGGNCIVLKPDGTWQYLEKGVRPSGHAEYC
ncbi:MAG: hypothetical protein ACTTKZ_04425 [Bacteroides sp.]